MSEQVTEEPADTTGEIPQSTDTELEATAEIPHSEEATDSDTVEPEADTEQEEESDTPPEIKALRRESAKWRTKYSETRTELESATTRLDELQKAQVETLLLAKEPPSERETVNFSTATPSVIWDLGKTVADFRDDDGNIDPEKVTEAAELLKQRFPHRVQPAPHGVRKSPEVPEEANWSDALKGSDR